MRVWDRLSSARSTSACARSTPAWAASCCAASTSCCLRVAWRVAWCSAWRAWVMSRRLRACSGLARAGALARQVAVALDFALGEAQVGGVGPRDRQRLADHRLMAFQRGVGVDELGRGHGQVGAGRGQGGHVFAVVDAGQQLAGGDALVVFRQHFLDEAGYLGRDHGVVGDDGGVVGGFGRRRARPGPAGVGKQASAPASAARGR